MKTIGFRITQWGLGKGAGETSFYLTALPIGKLLKAKYDRWSRNNRKGYQRAPSESRFSAKGKRSIVSYLLRESGTFPTSVLLNIRGELEFTPEGKIADKIEHGQITYSDDEDLWIIDGQHRLSALQRAISTEPSFKDYPLPITLTNFKDIFDEMLNFYLVNARQNKIPTNLVYRHLQTMQQEAILNEKPWLEVAILGEKETRAALATEIVDFLEDDDNSPFKNKIQFTGEPREDYHLVRDYSLSSLIARILNETAFSQLDPMTLAEIISDYWAVIKELYPKSFKDNRNYTLLKSTGLASFTYLLPSIFARCAKDRQITKSRFKHYLIKLQDETIDPRLTPEFQIPINDEWWSRANGPTIASSTGNKIFTEIMKSMSKKIDVNSGGK